MIVFHSKDKVDIWGVHQVGHNVITFVAPVEDNNCLAVEVVALEHFHQCARFILMGCRLYNRVKVGAVVDVKQGT